MLKQTTNISLELLSHDGSDNSIANTARVSMEVPNGDWDGMPAGYSAARRNGLIKYLAKHKHTSPFRHTSVTLRCKVPVFLARQLGKHQAGLSWNEVSRRYVDTGLEFYRNKPWRKRPENAKQGSDGEFGRKDQHKFNIEYLNTCGLLLDQYNKWIEEGVAPEQARMILPQSMMVEFIWTGNIMAFSHVYNLRADTHAQQEVNEFAKLLNEAIAPVFPVAWEALTTREEQ